MGTGPSDTVLDADPAPPHGKRHSSLHFCSLWTEVLNHGHVYCGQRAGWIRIPLGTEIGLSPGDTVLDDDSAPLPLPKEGGWSTAAPSSLFSPCLLWPNGWINQDTTWYGGRSQPRRHCDRGSPSSRSWTKAYLCTKWHLDPSNRLATIHQHYTDRDCTDQPASTSGISWLDTGDGASLELMYRFCDFGYMPNTDGDSDAAVRTWYERDGINLGKWHLCLPIRMFHL